MISEKGYNKTMKVLCPGDVFEAVGSSIFLAGPTPRSAEVTSWRPHALDILKNLGFDGNVWVPERQDWSVKFNYDDQIEWEWDGLDNCRVIAFWVPRSIPDMPAFTTNVEFGRYVTSGRILYGRPDGAVNTRYLDYMYEKQACLKPINTLEELMKQASAMAKGK